MPPFTLFLSFFPQAEIPSHLSLKTYNFHCTGFSSIQDPQAIQFRDILFNIPKTSNSPISQSPDPLFLSNPVLTALINSSRATFLKNNPPLQSSIQPSTTMASYSWGFSGDGYPEDIYMSVETVDETHVANDTATEAVETEAGKATNGYAWDWIGVGDDGRGSTPIGGEGRESSPITDLLFPEENPSVQGAQGEEDTNTSTWPAETDFFNSNFDMIVNNPDFVPVDAAVTVNTEVPVDTETPVDTAVPVDAALLANVDFGFTGFSSDPLEDAAVSDYVAEMFDFDKYFQDTMTASDAAASGETTTPVEESTPDSASGDLDSLFGDNQLENASESQPEHTGSEDLATGPSASAETGMASEIPDAGNTITIPAIRPGTPRANTTRKVGGSYKLPLPEAPTTAAENSTTTALSLPTAPAQQTQLTLPAVPAQQTQQTSKLTVPAAPAPRTQLTLPTVPAQQIQQASNLTPPAAAPQIRPTLPTVPAQQIQPASNLTLPAAVAPQTQLTLPTQPASNTQHVSKLTLPAMPPGTRLTLPATPVQPAGQLIDVNEATTTSSTQPSLPAGAQMNLPGAHCDVSMDDTAPGQIWEPSAHQAPASAAYAFPAPSVPIQASTEEEEEAALAALLTSSMENAGIPMINNIALSQQQWNPAAQAMTGPSNPMADAPVAAPNPSPSTAVVTAVMDPLQAALEQGDVADNTLIYMKPRQKGKNKATAPVAAAPMAVAPMVAVPMATAPMATAPMATAPMAAAPMVAAPMVAPPIVAAPRVVRGKAVEAKMARAAAKAAKTAAAKTAAPRKRNKAKNSISILDFQSTNSPVFQQA